MSLEDARQGNGETARRRVGSSDLLRHLWRAGFMAAAAGLVAFLAGFMAFASVVPGEEVEIRKKADAIVVLTGGALRIRDAIELLAAGHGERLLITGVNPATKSSGLAQLIPVYKPMFDCCIDLDHSATNTVGNAIAARQWSRGNRFRSLIVVTSNYHLPRAMAELGHQLPDVRLIPFPVVTRKTNEPWWTNAALTRLIATEYVKYIFAILRNRLDLTSTTNVAADRGYQRS